MNSSRLVSLFLNVVDQRKSMRDLKCWYLLSTAQGFVTGQDAAADVLNLVPELLPDDGVHAPDLGCALQNTEGLGKGLGLVCRSQGCPVTTATNSRAEVMPRKRSRKRKGGQTGIQQTPVTHVHVHTTQRHTHTPTHSASSCTGQKKKSSHMMFQ